MGCIACEVNGLSGSGSGTGRLIDCGRGTRQDYERLERDPRGAVALISAARDRIGVWWQLLAREAAFRGVLALVLFQLDSEPVLPLEMDFSGSALIL